MITKQEHTGNIKIEDYGFAEWLAQVEQVINQGYKFDFVDNANYPVGYGSMYTAVLVPVMPVVAEVASSIKSEAPWGDTTDLNKALDLLQKEPVVEVQVEPTVQAKRKNAKA